MLAPRLRSRNLSPHSGHKLTFTALLETGRQKPELFHCQSIQPYLTDLQWHKIEKGNNDEDIGTTVNTFTLQNLLTIPQTETKQSFKNTYKTEFHRLFFLTIKALNCTVLTGQRNATTKAASYFLRVNPRNQTEAELTAGNEMEMQGVLLGSRSNDSLVARRNRVWTKTETPFGKEHQGYSPSGTLDKIKTGKWSRTPSNFCSVTLENTKQPPCNCKRGMNEPCWLI